MNVNRQLNIIYSPVLISTSYVFGKYVSKEANFPQFIRTQGKYVQDEIDENELEQNRRMLSEIDTENAGEKDEFELKDPGAKVKASVQDQVSATINQPRTQGANKGIEGKPVLLNPEFGVLHPEFSDTFSEAQMAVIDHGVACVAPLLSMTLGSDNFSNDEAIFLAKVWLGYKVRNAELTNNTLKFGMKWAEQIKDMSPEQMKAEIIKDLSGAMRGNSFIEQYFSGVMFQVYKFAVKFPELCKVFTTVLDDTVTATEDPAKLEELREISELAYAEKGILAGITTTGLLMHDNASSQVVEITRLLNIQKNLRSKAITLTNKMLKVVNQNRDAAGKIEKGIDIVNSKLANNSKLIDQVADFGVSALKDPEIVQMLDYTVEKGTEIVEKYPEVVCLGIESFNKPIFDLALKISGIVVDKMINEEPGCLNPFDAEQGGADMGYRSESSQINPIHNTRFPNQLEALEKLQLVIATLQEDQTMVENEGAVSVEVNIIDKNPTNLDIFSQALDHEVLKVPSAILTGTGKAIGSKMVDTAIDIYHGDCHPIVFTQELVNELKNIPDGLASVAFRVATLNDAMAKFPIISSAVSSGLSATGNFTVTFVIDLAYNTGLNIVNRQMGSTDGFSQPTIAASKVWEIVQIGRQAFSADTYAESGLVMSSNLGSMAIHIGIQHVAGMLFEKIPAAKAAQYPITFLVTKALATGIATNVVEKAGSQLGKIALPVFKTLRNKFTAKVLN